MNEKTYRIGYIDEDTGQVKKYKRRLRKYGFEIIGYAIKKGITLDSLMEQVYKSNIDLLMIDYKLKEKNFVSFNGEEVESEVYDKMPLFPHIIFTNKVDQAEPHVEDWKIIFDKTEVFEDKNSIERFVETLKRSIIQYRKHIESKKEKLANLLEKGEKEGLNTVEKDIIVSLQKELQSLYKVKIKEVPEHLISIEKLEDLEKSRKEAEEFLQSLIKKNKKK